MNKAVGVLIFAAGAAVGSLVTWEIAKQRFTQLAREEIDSVKSVYSKRYEQATVGIDISHKLDETTSSSDKSQMMDYYNKKVKDEGYMDYSTNGKKVSDSTSVKSEAKKPYVITPDEFGTRDDYSTISLTYYADKVVTDEENDPLENIDDYIGYESLEHFGEYEDDSVFVRNEELKTDYEILLDNRNYSDVAKTKPKK